MSETPDRDPERREPEDRDPEGREPEDRGPEPRDPETCEACGEQPATIHVRRVFEGEETETHLCLECARKEGLEPKPPAGEDLGPDVVAALIQNLGETEGSGGICPACGLSFSGFRDTGRLGCATCYETFADELEPLLRRIHGAVRHAGKKPVREGARYEQAALLRRLTEELERAVGAEDYEQAARLRDRIQEMESAETLPEAGA